MIPLHRLPSCPVISEWVRKHDLRKSVTDRRIFSHFTAPSRVSLPFPETVEMGGLDRSLCALNGNDRMVILLRMRAWVFFSSRERE